LSVETVGALTLGAAGVLVVFEALLSLFLDLGIARSLLVAASRMIVQLLLVGFVLAGVFRLGSPVLVGLVILAMIGAGSREVFARQGRRLKGLWGFGIGAGATGAATILAAGVGLAALAPSPWFAPQIVIPLVGIVLGSAMNGVGVSLNAFNVGVARERAAIEARLALGDPASVACRSLRREALHSGLIPIVNQMSAAGIITLPGMMTGQILAGLPPFEAAKYQIFILLLLAAASGFGAILGVEAAARRLTDQRDRLRMDRLEEKQ
jgi:putative ABC transport system permease protein